MFKTVSYKMNVANISLKLSCFGNSTTHVQFLIIFALFLSRRNARVFTSFVYITGIVGCGNKITHCLHLIKYPLPLVFYFYSHLSMIRGQWTVTK